MADLNAVLEARRKQKGDEDAIFEGYGKKKYSFKEGKRGAYSNPAKLLKAIQVKGVESPTEPIDLEEDLREQQQQQQQELQAHQQQQQPETQQQQQQSKEQQQHEELQDPQQQQQLEQQRQQQHQQQQQRPREMLSRKSIELMHRHKWASRHLSFTKDSESPEIRKKAKELERAFKLPKQVAVRIALLYQYRDNNVGEEIANVYLEAIAALQRGLPCSRLCQQSLKVRRSLLQLQFPDPSLLLKDLGVFRFFSSPKFIDFRILKDLYLGTKHSEEFCEVNKRIRSLGQVLQETRCCVLSTALRTYSLLMDRPKDLEALCAVVDVATGRHGPAVWASRGVTEAVFATELQAQRLK